MSTQTMRAVTVAGSHTLATADVPVADPGPGQALVRVSACGICGSDLHMFELDSMPRGTVLGHEFCGTIEAVGSGATARRGERYVCWPLLGCRECGPCRAGLVLRCQSPKRIGLGGSGGGYAEYALVDTETLLPIPDSVDDETAALTEPLSVGLHAVRISSLRPGDSCVVIGAGCIGLMVLQCVILAGAVDVSVIEPAPHRAEAARGFGATRVFASGDEAWDHHLGARPDVVIECAGAPGTLQLAGDLVKERGEVIGAGVITEDTLRVPTWLLKELTLRMASETHDDFPRAMRLLQSGRIRPAAMVTKRATLDEIPGLFNTMGVRGEVKILAVP
jgi:(R,R)-butanediol dehydrogenase/meso-butanediol dehydrogenase/diacetyl reductase